MVLNAPLHRDFLPSKKTLGKPVLYTAADGANWKSQARQPACISHLVLGLAAVTKAGLYKAKRMISCQNTDYGLDYIGPPCFRPVIND